MEKQMKERMDMFMVEKSGKEIKKWIWYSQENENKTWMEENHD